METLHALLLVIYTLHVITRNAVSSKLNSTAGEPSQTDVETKRLRRDEELGNELLERTLHSAFLKVRARFAERRKREILDYLNKRKTKQVITTSAKPLVEDIDPLLRMSHVHNIRNSRSYGTGITRIGSGNDKLLLARVKVLYSSNRNKFVNETRPLLNVRSTTNNKEQITVLQDSSTSPLNGNDNLVLAYNSKGAVNHGISMKRTSCCEQGYESKCCPNEFGHTLSKESSVRDGCCRRGYHTICCPNNQFLMPGVIENLTAHHCCSKVLTGNDDLAHPSQIGVRLQKNKKSRSHKVKNVSTSNDLQSKDPPKSSSNFINAKQPANEQCYDESTNIGYDSQNKSINIHQSKKNQAESSHPEVGRKEKNCVDKKAVKMQSAGYSNFTASDVNRCHPNVLLEKSASNGMPRMTKHSLCEGRKKDNITAGNLTTASMSPTKSRMYATLPINKPSSGTHPHIKAKALVISPRPPLIPPPLSVQGTTAQTEMKKNTSKITKEKTKDDLKYRMKVKLTKKDKKLKKRIKIKYNNKIIRLKLVKKKEKRRKKGRQQTSHHERKSNSRMLKVIASPADMLAKHIEESNAEQSVPLIRVKREIKSGFDESTSQKTENNRTSKIPLNNISNLEGSRVINNKNNENSNKSTKGHGRYTPLTQINAHDSDLRSALTLKNRILHMRVKTTHSSHKRHLIVPKVRKKQRIHNKHAHKHHRKRRGNNSSKKPSQIVVQVRKNNIEIVFRNE